MSVESVPLVPCAKQPSGPSEAQAHYESLISERRLIDDGFAGPALDVSCTISRAFPWVGAPFPLDRGKSW